MRTVWILSCCALLPAQGSRTAAPAARGTLLTFRIDPRGARQRGWVRPGTPEPDVPGAIATAARQEIDPEGKQGVVMTAAGPGIRVLLPALPGAAVDEVIAGLMAPRSMELHFVADAHYRASPVPFDRTQAEDQLRAWLAIPDQRASVLADPLAIVRFNSTIADRELMRWVPEYAQRRPAPPGQVAPGAAWRVVHTVPGAVKPLGPDVPLDVPGFVPLNMHECGFTGTDLFLDAAADTPDGAALRQRLEHPEQTDVAGVTAATRPTGSLLAGVLNGMVVATVAVPEHTGLQTEDLWSGLKQARRDALFLVMQRTGLRLPLVLVAREPAPRR